MIPIAAVAAVAYDVVGSDDPKQRMNIRDAVLGLWNIVQWGQRFATGLYRIDDEDRYSLDGFRSVVIYGCEHPSTKKRTPMNVDEMVKRWIPIIKGLATAHEKATLDECEFKSEEHMTPLLAAPVAQLRAFYTGLTAALKADPQVPFFVWAMFDAWGETILKHAPDADVRELKDQLAEQIAALVEKEVQPDLKAAIAGALRWRSAETLEKIKAAAEGGAKPRLKGRESCLFLIVGDETVML